MDKEYLGSIGFKGNFSCICLKECEEFGDSGGVEY